MTGWLVAVGVTAALIAICWLVARGVTAALIAIYAHL